MKKHLDELLKMVSLYILEIKKQDKEYSEPEWLEQVYAANLETDPKSLFLLGALAYKVFDGAPEAMVKTLDLMRQSKL